MNKKPNSRYEWFRGENQKSPKSQHLARAKKAGKVIKAVFFGAILIFTLTGCVQNFIVKTDSQTGRGLEIFSSEKYISPHAVSLNMTERDNKNAYSSEVKKIYELGYADKSHSVNKQDVLQKLRTSLKVQSKAKNLKMSDAWKGTNEVTRFLKNNQVINNLKTSDGIASEGDNLLIISSLSNNPEEMKRIYGDTTPDLSEAKILIQKGKEKTYELVSPIIEQPDLAKLSEQSKARYYYSMTLFSKIWQYYNGAFSFIQSLPDKNDKKQYDAAVELAKIQSNNWHTVTQYLGLHSTSGDHAERFSFSKNSKGVVDYVPLPNAGGKTQTWRPVSNWKRAWNLGPFYGMFIYPLGAVSDMLIHALPVMKGGESVLTIFVVVFFIRIITFLLTFKSTLQQAKMQELAAKKAIIDAKYAPYKGNKQMEARQKQEVADMYKKEGISVMGSFASTIVTMPLFLAIWRITTGLTTIKSTTWLGISFAATSYKELFAGSLQYLPLLFLALVFAILQTVVPRLLAKKREKVHLNVHQKQMMKKNNKMMYIMGGVMVIFAVIFTAGVQIYWIVSGLLSVIQSVVSHYVILKQQRKKKHRI